MEVSRHRVDSLLDALSIAPHIIVPLMQEVPPEILRYRPAPGEWSVQEHAYHISLTQDVRRRQLEEVLANPGCRIESSASDARECLEILKEADLQPTLEHYAAARAALVGRLLQLSPEQWRATARHPRCSCYSIFTMLRSLLLDEMHHAHRIEELLLESGGEIRTSQF